MRTMRTVSLPLRRIRTAHDVDLVRYPRINVFSASVIPRSWVAIDLARQIHCKVNIVDSRQVLIQLRSNKY